MKTSLALLIGASRLPPKVFMPLNILGAIVWALLFVRLFRSLDSIVGEEGTARAWLNSDNKGLNARPIELISQTEGLVRVVHYLDASRGLS